MTELRTVDTDFDPETVKLLAGAYESALRALGIADDERAVRRGSRALRETLARCVIETARAGERNPHRLRDRALAHASVALLR
jgi:hypothetical protein